MHNQEKRFLTCDVAERKANKLPLEPNKKRARSPRAHRERERERSPPAPYHEVDGFVYSSYAREAFARVRQLGHTLHVELLRDRLYGRHGELSLVGRHN